MTILWCGGEDVDFPNNTAGFHTFTGSDHSRLSIASIGWAESNLFSAHFTSGWMSFYSFESGGSGTHIDYKLLGLCAHGGAYNGIYIGTGDNENQIAVWKYSGSSWTKITQETGTSWFSGVRIDVNVTYGASGSITVYANGTQCISYSGDLTISGVDYFDCLVMPNTDIWWGLFYVCESEIIVADEDTRLMRLKTIAPSAAGDTNDWTGAYTDVDETTLSDSDKIYSVTDDDDFQCNLTGMPSGTWSVKAVKVAARCVDGSGSTGIQLGVKSGGTVDSGDTQEASGYWQTKERLMQVNPVTGVAFTPAEIEVLQVNLRAKAL
jgi:hypothetical protein